MPEKPKHGGARKGAGRPTLNGPTRTLTMRIPQSDLDALEAAGITNFSAFYVKAGKAAIRRLKK